MQPTSLFNVLQVNRLKKCIIDVGRWMSANRLKLNTDKTELLWTGSKHSISQLHGHGPSIPLGASTIPACDHVRLLGVIILADLSLDCHVSVVSSASFYWLWQLRRVRWSLDDESAAILIHAFIISRVDYCNLLLAGAPTSVICYWQVAVGHEHCSASRQWHKEVRLRLDTPASLWAILARYGRSSHIQAWGDGVQVLAWPGTELSVWAVYTGRSSCRTTASSFHQLPSTRCSTVSARYVRPSHLRWINDMKLVPKQFAWAENANCLFSSYTEDVSFWTVLGTSSALEALFLRQCAI